jgi:hypothetical protein
MPTGTPPSGGKIGGVKKEYVYIGVGLGAVVIVVYIRSKKAAAATSTMVSDPAGNQCAVLSPTSGYCPNTPQDLAYQNSGTLVGANSASYVGGQVVGYDQYGSPIYSSNSGQGNVPGQFTNNAQWTQYALSVLQSADPNTDSGIITDALGAYINALVPSASQTSIIHQAIALAGYPPISGTAGYPPNIKTGPTGGGTAPGVPNGLKIIQIQPTSVVINWNAVTGAITYVVKYSASYGSWTTKTVSPSVTLGLLRTKTKFTVQVQAVNASGTSALSSPITFTSK